jgi:aryl-alcohol dehydrogenase-like predicted oxidoreductase
MRLYVLFANVYCKGPMMLGAYDSKDKLQAAVAEYLNMVDTNRANEQTEELVGEWLKKHREKKWRSDE